MSSELRREHREVILLPAIPGLPTLPERIVICEFEVEGESDYDGWPVYAGFKCKEPADLICAVDDNQENSWALCEKHLHLMEHDDCDIYPKFISTVPIPDVLDPDFMKRYL